MTYVTKKCPYCNYTFQFMKTGNQRQYGCPLKNCPNCHEYYFDSDIVEPALHGYGNRSEKNFEDFTLQDFGGASLRLGDTEQYDISRFSIREELNDLYGAD